MNRFNVARGLCQARSSAAAVSMVLASVTTVCGSLFGCVEGQHQHEAASVDETTSASMRTATEKLDRDFRRVPDDTLTDQHGNHVALANLRGKVWVADFIFTRCSGPCPVMSQKMSQLQRAFMDSADVIMVSFSVDPVFDTPSKLAAYARAYGAVEGRWLFLTTLDKARVWDLAMRGFALSAGEDTTATGRGMIFHDERLVVVDHRGGIRGYVHSSDVAWMEKTVRRVSELLDERRRSL